jgi:hypothetical protein
VLHRSLQEGTGHFGYSRRREHHLIEANVEIWKTAFRNGGDVRSKRRAVEA